MIRFRIYIYIYIYNGFYKNIAPLLTNYEGNNKNSNYLCSVYVAASKHSWNSLILFTWIFASEKLPYIKFFRRLWVGSEGIAPKIREKQLVCSSREWSTTPEASGKEFLSKEQCDNTLAHPYAPHLAPIGFYLFLEWNQHCRDGSFVKLLTSLRMRRKSWKGFHNMASRNVSNNFQKLVEVFSCKSWIFGRKCS